MSSAARSRTSGYVTSQTLVPAQCHDELLAALDAPGQPNPTLSRAARTFVWVADKPADLVVGYYCLTAHRLVRDALPTSIGRGCPTEIPAVLLAGLAMERSQQWTGAGGALLADAPGRIVVATRTVAARFVKVDALHERAAGFYEHHGFRRIPGTRRPVQKVSDIAAVIGRV